MSEIHAPHRAGKVLQAEVGEPISMTPYPATSCRRLDSAQFRVMGRTDKLNRAGQAC
jgi:hypothetical protein